jgi:ankyrin repeat protein
MFLFNDIIIITSYQKESSTMKLLKNKYAIHQVLPLERMAISCKSSDAPDNPCAFSIHMPERVYTLFAESESDKRIWLEEIELAIFAWHSGTARCNDLGWQHETILGTLFSDAYSGKLDGVLSQIAARTAEDGKVSTDSLNASDASGMSALHWAAVKGHLPVIRALLDAGCDVDCLNNGLNSPLLLAAGAGHEAIIAHLLQRGADPTLRNLKDRDVLFMATLYGHTSKGLSSTLQLLHFNRVDFDQLDASGSAPLHECASRNLPRPIRLLVHAGANVNTKHGRTGVTPLQLACSMESPDVETVRSFLESGAHPNWKDASGNSAFNMMLSAHQSVCPKYHFSKRCCPCLICLICCLPSISFVVVAPRWPPAPPLPLPLPPAPPHHHQYPPRPHPTKCVHE